MNRIISTLGLLAILVTVTLAFAFFSNPVRADTAPAYTNVSRFFRFQCDPAFAADGSPVSAVVQAFFKTTISDGTTTFEGPMQTVSWDAVATASETVTLPSGKVLTRGEVLQAVIAIAQQIKDTPPTAPPAPAGNITVTP